MSGGWDTVPLGEIAAPIARTVHVERGKTYRTIGVKWWGEGAYERQTIDGSQTAAKRLSLVRRNDLIINKIWVRHGSVAVAGEEVDGCAASNEFPMFELDQERVIPRWLHWYSKTTNFWHACDALSRGSSGKNRIRPEAFLTIRVPLAPLCEQRRIIARIDEVAAKIDEARELRSQSIADCERLCATLVRSRHDAVSTPMDSLVRARSVDTVVDEQCSYHFAGVYSFGRGVFRGSIKSGSDFSYRNLTRLRRGDFVYPKLMAWEGALGVVPPECDGLFVSPEFPVFEIDKSRVLPEVLDLYFRSPAVWPLLAEVSIGTNVRRRRLQPSAFLQLRIPLLPMETQRRIRYIKERVDAIRRLQAGTATRLEALLPAVLNEAFTGQLCQ